MQEQAMGVMGMIRSCQLAASVALLALLASCSGRDSGAPDLARYHSKGAPDEFAVVVYNRILVPDRTEELPPPGAVRTRVRQNPEALADRALGGRPAAPRDNQTPPTDRGLLNHMAALGMQDDIRQIVAREDLEVRRANPGRFLERAFRTNIYYRAYEGMTLDPTAETERLSGLGYRVLPPPADPSSIP